MSQPTENQPQTYSPQQEYKVTDFKTQRVLCPKPEEFPKGYNWCVVPIPKYTRCAWQREPSPFGDYNENEELCFSKEDAERIHCTEDTIVMPRTLTAEDGFKAALMGEFFEEIETLDPETDEEVTQKVHVSWTTIKSIYKRVVEIVEGEASYEEFK